MNNTKKLIAVSIIAAFLPSIANALPGYATDTSGKVVRNSYNECWHAGFWIPSMAIAECDPDLVKKVDAPTTKLAAAKPEPVPVPLPEPVPEVVGPVLQRLLSRTLLISVTAPMRASSRPITVAPFWSEML